MKDSQDILHTMFQLVYALKKDFNIFLSDYDVTEMEAKFIFFIKKDQVSVTDLINYFKKHKSTITQKTKSLCDKGYLQTDTSHKDKRERMFSLTQKGLDWVKMMKQAKKDYYSKIFKHITEKEKKQLLSLMGKLEIYYENDHNIC